MATSNYVQINGEYYAPGTKQAKAHAQSLAGLAPQKPEQNQVRSLDGKLPRSKNCKRSVVIVVAFQPYVSHPVDDDNFGSGVYKALRDAIAQSLGIDDGDGRIRWEYHPPIVTRGATGTHVTISRV